MSSGAFGGADRHADLAGLANDDHKQYAMYSSGPAASRPAAGRSGRLYYATDTGALYEDTGSAWASAVGGSPMNLIASAAAERPLTVKGASGQTANLTEWQNSAGATLAAIQPDGGIRLGGATTGAALNAFSLGAGGTVAIIRGAASQAGNLTEWQNSSGTVLTSIRPNGALSFDTPVLGGSGVTGGGSNALPANPVDYIHVWISGAERKIPFYN